MRLRSAIKKTTEPRGLSGVVNRNGQTLAHSSCEKISIEYGGSVSVAE
ncbi:hypothetical protein K2D_38670 [Planctomycetes bacterium K2D]|nr:hypothetical protein K2D_38670 [Planctomycetes bacterium K2D]